MNPLISIQLCTLTHSTSPNHQNPCSLVLLLKGLPQNTKTNTVSYYYSQYCPKLQINTYSPIKISIVVWVFLECIWYTVGLTLYNSKSSVHSQVQVPYLYWHGAIDRCLAAPLAEPDVGHDGGKVVETKEEKDQEEDNDTDGSDVGSENWHLDLKWRRF